MATNGVNSVDNFAQLSGFWRDVISAHDLVAANHDLVLDVARNSMKAVVRFVDLGDETVINIMISAADTKMREPLISP